jgi:hypothetical protein
MVVSDVVMSSSLVLGEGPRGHEIIRHVAVLELVLDYVCMLRACLLKKSLEVVCWWPCLALATACSSRDVLHVGVIHFLFIIVVVGHGSNPLRVPLSPLLAALGILLGALDGDAGWCHVGAARGHFPAAWDRERSGYLIVGDVLDGDAEQLPGGVPENVIRCLEGQYLLRVAPKCLCSWSPRTTTVSLSVIVPTPSWITHVAFMSRAHVPRANLAVHLVFHTLGRLPQRALGWNPSR